MPVRSVLIPGIGPIKLVKHAQARSLKISIDGRNQLRVSMPVWVPYRVAIDFAIKKQDWINKHWNEQLLVTGTAIGRAHRLVLEPNSNTNKLTTKVVNNEVRVTYPDTYSPTEPAVQTAILRVANKALRQQAEKLLPPRLVSLAQQHGFDYSSIKIKNLKTRWGSCNNNQEITLNFYLMQLPIELIDYVLIHELVHTEILNHQSDFWHRVETCLPNYKTLRRQLRTYKPTLVTNLS